MDSTRRINELYSKQGRNAQFKTKKERDAFLKKEIKEVEEQRAVQNEQALFVICILNFKLNALDDEIKNIRSSIEENNSQKEILAEELNEKKNVVEQITKSLNEKKAQRDSLSNKRK